MRRLPRVFASARSRGLTAVYLLLGGAGLAALAYLARGRLTALADPEALRAFLEGFGPLAPAAFVGLVAAQVVVAPVPGQVLGFVGGYLFGTVAGTAYSLLGLAIGTAAAVSLARRFGRRYVERAVHPDALATFDRFTDRQGLFAFFLIFLIPGLPDDAICFLAGVTRIPVRKLVFVSAVGRLPGYFLVALAGDRLAAARVAEALVVVAALVALSAICYRRRAAVAERIRRH